MARLGCRLGWAWTHSGSRGRDEKLSEGRATGCRDPRTLCWASHLTCLSFHLLHLFNDSVPIKPSGGGALGPGRVGFSSQRLARGGRHHQSTRGENLRLGANCELAFYPQIASAVSSLVLSLFVTSKLLGPARVRRDELPPHPGVHARRCGSLGVILPQKAASRMWSGQRGQGLCRPGSLGLSLVRSGPSATCV